MRWLTLALVLTMVGSACASRPADFTLAGGADGGHSGPGTGTDTGPAGGTLMLVGEGGVWFGGGKITAAGGPNIVVHGQPTTVQLTATAGGNSITGTWTTSDTAV